MEKYRVPNRYRDIFGHTDPEYRTDLEKYRPKYRKTDTDFKIDTDPYTTQPINQSINQSIKQF